MSIKFNPFAGNFDYIGDEPENNLTLNGTILTLSTGNSVDLAALTDTDTRTITTGVLNATTGVITFTRDDNSTFLVDMSAILTATDLVKSVNGKVGIVVLSKSDVGLNNVDNTSDLNKPISTAIQQALDTKIEAETLTSLTFSNHTLRYVDENSTTNSIDLSVYNKTKLSELVNDAGYLKTVTEAQVTAHQSAISITQSQIIDLAPRFSENYNDLIDKPTKLSTFTNDVGFIKTYTVTQADVVAHQAALTITASQISDLPAETVTSLTLVGNVLTYTDEAGTQTQHDLSVYLGDSNVAGLVGGVYDAATKTLIFTRNDNTTFSVDASMFFDDTNLVTSVAGKTGTVVITKVDVGLENVDNTADLNKPISTATQLALDGKSDIGHNHDAAYEPADDSILKAVDIGIDIQAFDPNLVSDANYDHITVTNSSVSDGTNTFAQYVHPSTHNISEVTGLQAALDGKVDDSQVLTNVPANALFTDTVYDDTVIAGRVTALETAIFTGTAYDDTALSGRVTTLENAGFITGYTVTQADVTQYQSSITITESQISDLTPHFSGNYADLSGTPTIPADVSDLTDTTGLLTHFDGKYSSLTGTPTVVSSFTNDAGYLTSFTETDPVFTAWDKSTGISITESQISDLGNYQTADANLVSDANYRHITVTNASVSDGSNTFNQYVHPATHTISDIDGLQTTLDGKVDDSQVLTNVPANALFTDTVYDDTVIAGRVTTLENAGYITDYTVTQADVTQHQSNLTITESQISDLKNYLTTETTTSLTLVGNILTFTDETGNQTQHDLTLYLDDTNLARLVSGTYDAPTKTLVFTRDDNSTFSVDASVFFDDTNIVVSVDGKVGAVDLSTTYQPLDTNLVSDANYKHITVATTSVSDGTNTFSQYVHPLTHSVADIDGLQTVLDGKVDDSQVLTNVPAGALFTDTVYDDTAITGRVTTLENAGFITDYTVTQADVTQYQNSITITESQISDLTPHFSGKYADLTGTPTAVSAFTNDVGYLTTETKTTLTLVGNVLTFIDETGTQTQHDLTLYLDDTNLARLVSGVYDSQTQSLVFTRDDNTTFSVDASVFFDDTNLVTSVDGQTGAVNLTTVYEPKDITILKAANIGVNVQGFDANIVSDANYNHITVTGNSVSDGTTTFNQYVHPTTHNIADVSGLQDVLDSKVDDSQVLTNVPAGALFTDTVYDDTILSGRVTTLENAGYITDYTVTQEDVIAHQGTITITESQISDLTPHFSGKYADLTGTPTVISAFTNDVGYLTSETTTSLTLAGNLLTFTDETGTQTQHDLTMYLDDTNLARIISGTYNSTAKTLVFTRDDNSTFSIDASMFFDDTNLVTSVAGKTGNVVLSKSDIGLSNVDNTSDLNKPISTATQTALDGKVDDSQVLTNVPVNALFTDTVYDDTAIDGRVTTLENAGFLTSYTETDPVFTAWNKSTGISITKSQISDFGNYQTADANLVSDVNYRHITVTTTSVSDGTNTFNQYVHPTTHNIAEVDGLQLALDGKADNATTLAGYSIADAYTKDEIGTFADFEAVFDANK